DAGFDDTVGESGAEYLLEILPMDLCDFAVAFVQQVPAQAARGEGHDAAAGLPPRLVASDDAGLVQDDGEGPLGRRDGVDGIPSTRRRLVGEEGGADVWSVSDFAQRPPHVCRQIHRNSMCHGGRSGKHHRPGLYLVVGSALAVPDDNGLPSLDDFEYLGVELYAVTQSRRQRLGQRGGSTHDSAAQPFADVPHQAEVADAGTCRDLIGFAARPRDGGAEQGIDVVGEVADEVEEGAPILEVVDALLSSSALLAVALTHDAGVPDH